MDTLLRNTLRLLQTNSAEACKELSHLGMRFQLRHINIEGDTHGVAGVPRHATPKIPRSDICKTSFGMFCPYGVACALRQAIPNTFLSIPVSPPRSWVIGAVGTATVRSAMTMELFLVPVPFCYRDAAFVPSELYEIHRPLFPDR